MPSGDETRVNRAVSLGPEKRELEGVSSERAVTDADIEDLRDLTVEVLDEVEKIDQEVQNSGLDEAQRTRLTIANVQNTLTHLPGTEISPTIAAAATRESLLEALAAQQAVKEELTLPRGPGKETEQVKSKWLALAQLKVRLRRLMRQGEARSAAADEKKITDERTLATELKDHMDTIHDWMDFMGEEWVDVRVMLSKSAYVPLLMLTKIRGIGVWDVFKKAQQEWWLMRTSRHLMKDRWGSITGGKEGVWRLQDRAMTSEKSSFEVRVSVPQTPEWQARSTSEQMARLVYAKLRGYFESDQALKNFKLDDGSDQLTVGFWKDGRPYKLHLRLSELLQTKDSPHVAVELIQRSIEQILSHQAPPTVELGIGASRRLKAAAYQGRHTLSPEEETLLKADLHVHLDTWKETLMEN